VAQHENYSHRICVYVQIYAGLSENDIAVLKALVAIKKVFKKLNVLLTVRHSISA
jgi:hypothetical protein